MAGAGAVGTVDASVGPWPVRRFLHGLHLDPVRLGSLGLTVASAQRAADSALFPAGASGGAGFVGHVGRRGGHTAPGPGLGLAAGRRGPDRVRAVAGALDHGAGVCGGRGVIIPEPRPPSGGFSFQLRCSDPHGFGQFSRVALRILCSPDSIWDRAAWLIPASLATSAWVKPRCSRHARKGVISSRMILPMTSLGIMPAECVFTMLSDLFDANVFLGEYRPAA